ncbi:unnamed protein product, partial [Plutella xylostella]
ITSHYKRYFQVKKDKFLQISKDSGIVFCLLTTTCKDWPSDLGELLSNKNSTRLPQHSAS